MRSVEVNLSSNQRGNEVYSLVICREKINKMKKEKQRHKTAVRGRTENKVGFEKALPNELIKQTEHRADTVYRCV